MFVKVFHEFDWKTLNPQALEQVIDMSGRGVECLAYLSIEITMTDRLALRDERFGEMLKKITPHRRIPFTEGAFRPKTYTIRVERGAFDIPWLVDYGDAESRRLCPQYSLRLVFDLSPYSASQDWKQPDDANGCDKWKEFVSLESSLPQTLLSRCIVI